MKQINALIVEDNIMMAEVLTDLLSLEKYNLRLLHVARNGKDAIEKITELSPDVVFMDVELPDMTGFEILSRLNNINFQTIFTTAYSHYTIKAIRFSALDYLVKPIQETELDAAIKRFEMAKSNRAEVLNAIQNLKEEDPEEQNLVLPTQQGPVIIPLKNITQMEGERNYT